MGTAIEAVRDIGRRLLLLIRATAGRDVLPRRDIRIPTQRFGGAEGAGGWVLCPRYIDRSAIIYSAGVGTDVSFELALIESFNLQIHTFDPTPRSVRWLQQQQLPPQIVHHHVALADFNGELELYPPGNPDHVSFSPISHEGSQDRTVTVSARRLSSILDEHGHERVNVLKMDIEGSEYSVISNIVESNVVIDQLLVEFHHRFDTVPIKMTREAIRRLRQAGFRLFHVSPRGEEYSFIHRRCLESAEV